MESKPTRNKKKRWSGSHQLLKCWIENNFTDLHICSFYWGSDCCILPVLLLLLLRIHSTIGFTDLHICSGKSGVWERRIILFWDAAPAAAAADPEKVRPQLLSPLQAVNMDATTVTTLTAALCLVSPSIRLPVCVWNILISSKNINFRLANSSIPEYGSWGACAWYPRHSGRTPQRAGTDLGFKRSKLYQMQVQI